MNSFRNLFVCFLFFAYIVNVCSQQNSLTYRERFGDGVISGIVIDSETNKPVEFSTIALFNNSDSLISGGITNAGGNFKLEKIPFGNFHIEITFIGYKTLRKDNIIVSHENPEISIGKISISPNSELLKEVEVVGEKRMIEMSIDKKVFNVEKNITSAGRSAADVLQNVPSVSVDIDGNISLRGSGNVTVLIDGKPSGLTGSSRSAILQQIPASSIESVEVITNPSVKYDPDGMSGIINVILKKNQKTGANGSVSGGIGTRNKYNASANFNYRNGKINTYTNYSFRYNPVFGRGDMLRENFFTDSTWYLNQYNNSQNGHINHMAKIGADFFLNDFNTLSASVVFNSKTQTEDETTRYENLDNTKKLTNLYFRNNKENGENFNTDFSLNYKKKFKKPKQQLSADAVYSLSSEDRKEIYNQQNYYTDGTPKPENPYLQNIFYKRNFSVLTTQIDYTNPFGSNSKFETGAKSIIRNLHNDFYSETYNDSLDKWNSDTVLNARFLFNEQVYAGYGTLAGSVKKINYQIGLRLEQAYVSSKLLKTDSVFPNNYFSYFPGAHFSFPLNQKNELQLSYSKRINRPSVESLIGWMDVSDPLNIRMGNPKLKPEYIHSVEFGHIISTEKHTLTSSVYFRQIVNMIQRFRTVDSITGVAMVRFQNYASATNMGFEFVARNEFFKWWNVTSNLNLFKSVINASNIQSDLHNEGFSWSVKMTSNFNLPKGFQIQISGDYKAPTPVALGKMYPMNGVDLGVKKDLFKGKGSINLNISDVFDTRQFRIAIVQPDYNHSFTRKRETQIATLNFTYKFGKSDFQQKQKGRKEGEQIRGEDLF